VQALLYYYSFKRHFATTGIFATIKNGGKMRDQHYVSYSEWAVISKELGDTPQRKEFREKIDWLSRLLKERNTLSKSTRQ